jgi:hypothetical protein
MYPGTMYLIGAKILRRKSLARRMSHLGGVSAEQISFSGEKWETV